jgi:hypothetical protein
MKAKIGQFEKKLIKMHPHLKYDVEKIYNLTEDAMEFVKLVKVLGSYSFAVTAWRHKGGRHEDAFLDLANKTFNK